MVSSANGNGGNGLRMFEVRCPEAERVYLMLRVHDRVTKVLPMERSSSVSSAWWLELTLPPGDHPHRYYVFEGRRLRLCAPSVGRWGAASAEGDTAPAGAGWPEASAPDHPRRDGVAEETPWMAWPERWLRFPASRASEPRWLNGDGGRRPPGSPSQQEPW